MQKCIKNRQKVINRRIYDLTNKKQLLLQIKNKCFLLKNNIDFD